MTDLSQRMRVIFALDDEMSKPPEQRREFVIACAKAYLRHNADAPAHDFLTLSRPAEAA